MSNLVKVRRGDKISFAYSLPALSCQSHGTYKGVGIIVRRAQSKEHDWDKDLEVWVVREWPGKYTIVRRDEMRKLSKNPPTLTK